MNNSHRYFVQYMLQNGISPVNDALAYCRHASRGKIDNITQFKTLVIEINREISKQFYKIVFNVCEVTNKNVVVWLNTKNDEISKCQISYSTIELEYFDAILKEILNSEEHQITFIMCINISSTLTSHFSRENGQNVLNRWLKGGYYTKRGDYIHLGSRTILEFTSYLRSNCPDSICSLCSEIVFTGKKCGNCDKTLHSYCLSTYLKHQNGCPCCHHDWPQTFEEDQDDAMDINYTYATETNGTLTNGTNVSKVNSTQNERTMSPTLVNNARRSERVRHSQKRDIDEAGPSTRRKYK